MPKEIEENRSIQEICEDLSNNFLFQASLGSKELFHSNMLAWLLEQPNLDGRLEALELFGRNVLKIKSFPKIYFSMEEDENKSYAIKREKYHIDITIEWKGENGRNFAFIENKMKSIPTNEQLKEYNKKIEELYPPDKDKIHKRLLTPFKPSINIKEWDIVTYKHDILCFIQDCETIKFKNDITIFLEKYIHLINNLIRLVDKFQINDEDIFLNRKYNFYSKEIMKPIIDIRLHDLILKILHDKIREIVKEKVNEPNKFEFWSGFSNQEGITDIKFKIEQKKENKNLYEHYLVIQLQGASIKYGVEVKYEDLSTKEKAIEKNILFAKSLYQQSNLWFFDIETSVKLKGKGRNKGKLKYVDVDGGFGVFNSYSDGSFIYLTKKIEKPELMYVKEIIELIVKSANHIRINQDKFKKYL